MRQIRAGGSGLNRQMLLPTAGVSGGYTQRLDHSGDHVGLLITEGFLVTAIHMDTVLGWIALDVRHVPFRRWLTTRMR
jgi:hypothetical protein